MLQAVVDCPLEISFEEAEIIPALLVVLGPKLWLRQIPGLLFSTSVLDSISLDYMRSQLDGTLVVLGLGIEQAVFLDLIDVLVEEAQLGGRLREIDTLQDLLNLPLAVGLEAAASTQDFTEGSCRLHGQVLDHRGGLLFRRGLVWGVLCIRCEGLVNGEGPLVFQSVDYDGVGHFQPRQGVIRGQCMKGVEILASQLLHGFPN